MCNAGTARHRERLRWGRSSTRIDGRSRSGPAHRPNRASGLGERWHWRSRARAQTCSSRTWSRRRTTPQETVRLIEDAGLKAVTVPGDLRDEAVCQRVVDAAVREFGRIDVLVSNAAFQMAQNGAIADTTSEQFDRVMKTNVYALFWLTKAAIPHMSEGSSIITTSSVQGFSLRSSEQEQGERRAGWAPLHRAGPGVGRWCTAPSSDFSVRPLPLREAVGRYPHA
ncbi:SDR family oxidoreductase [Pseudonocardia charpentierae]|uniref:SDR family oxidoreductase n=1 Tax=Pseudonocardia charpentierae TaxID=3075545 RepID=A0ABU2NCG8_9PSEU|nr:SDR family oxidoreductase [Pseudonocardia sp. DSM 45834]MDT0351645.1 SDR family oxidoreductase [Pseudonocardia sp. DSM 45834]